jgi:hypothetical protein
MCLQTARRLTCIQSGDEDQRKWALLTFKEYLVVRKAGADEAGDFIRLARRDPGFPDATSLEEVLAYLEGRGAHEALVGARETWRKYVIAVRNANRKKALNSQRV